MICRRTGQNNIIDTTNCICLLRATEQLLISHLFIQSTVLFALSKSMRFTLTKVKSKFTFVKCFAYCSDFWSRALFAPK